MCDNNIPAGVCLYPVDYLLTVLSGHIQRVFVHDGFAFVFKRNVCLLQNIIHTRFTDLIRAFLVKIDLVYGTAHGKELYLHTQPSFGGIRCRSGFIFYA